ncbi:MAG: proline--tRNA ligase, partial [Bacteroidales bacterium]|nr:proline--tRNA ligase [Bacteroidales bacterium]
EGIADYVLKLMDDIQDNIYKKALDFRQEHTIKVDTWDEFKEKIEQGYFLLCHWDGTTETELKIQEETKATIRCIPSDSFVCEEPGKCVYSGKPSARRVVFAKAY